MEKVKLTSLSHGSGCGCKIGRDALSRILRHLPQVMDPNVMVGTATADDAAVYKIDGKRALVQTVDFFTPVVDDPYDYGRIAAANAISDIYAMGGRPLFALSIIAFPIETLPLSILEGIIRGGTDKAREAGIEIIGGHSIEDPEPKYGLCVTGIIEQDKVVRNDRAAAGDLLILTKPLGTGIISKAIKSGDASAADIEEAVRVMTFLNRGASEAMVEAGIKAATDVTGFGLLGHLHGMLKGSHVGALLKSSAIPLIRGASDYAEKGFIPGGTRDNLASMDKKVVWSAAISQETKYILADAQTSGGLLISCPREKRERLTELLYQANCIAVAEIGEVIEDKGHRIRVD